MSEIRYFSIGGRVFDNSFGNFATQESTTVEIWRKRPFFEEFFTSFVIPSGSTKYSHNFSAPYDSDEEYEFYLKVNTNGQELKNWVDLPDVPTIQLTYFSLTPEPTTLDIRLEMPIEWIAGESEMAIPMVGRLVDESDATPFAGYKVRTSIDHRGEILADMGETTTNGAGYFSFVLVNNRDVAYATYQDLENVSFIAEVLDENGQFITSTSSLIDSPEQRSFVFETSISEETPETSITISELASNLSITIPTEINTYLSSNSISTLKDIRRAGGLKHQAELIESEHQDAIILLDGHAQFELVSDDYELNDFLISTKGYSNLYQVSEKDRADFIKDAESYSSDAYLKLAKIYVAAKTGQQVMMNLYTANMANTTPILEGSPVSSLAPASLLEAPRCNCNTCKSSVSPLAYLSDLIEYAVENINWSGASSSKATKRQELQDLFCLKFLEIKNKCSEIDLQVCQYRVAIEVLMCYMEDAEPGTCQQSAFNNDEKLYLRTAYFTLLEELGTTYSELRDTLKDTTERQQKLANRLGIVLTHSGNNTLEKMWLDPQAPLASAKEITAEKLETIFGLRNHNEPATYTQPDPLIKAWKQAYLEQLWLEQSYPEYQYNSLGLPIIEPDIIGPDDLRNPNVGNAAFDIWKLRRDFLDKTVLEDNLKEEGVTLTPKGIDQGVSILTLDASTVDLTPNNSMLEIINSSTGINGIYEVAATDGSTVSIVGQLASASIGGASVKLGKAIKIKDVDESNDQIVVDGDLSSELNIGSSVSIISSDTNNGHYEITAVSFASGETTVTLAGGLSASTVTGILGYRATHNITAITRATQTVRIKGDITTIASSVDSLTISNSTSNNGSYDVIGGAAYDMATDLTTFTLDEDTPLTDGTEEGTVLVDITGIGISSFDPGARTFIIDAPDLASIGIISATDTIIVEGGAGGNDGDYTVGNISYAGTENFIVVDEAIDSNVVAGNISIQIDIDAVGGSSGNNDELTVSYDLTDLYGVNDEIKLAKASGGIETYTIASISATTIVLDVSSDTGLTASDTIKLSLPITEIDISGRKITADAELVGHLFIGNTITVAHTSGGVNKGTYTIVDLTPNGSDTDLYVKEALETDTVTNYSISFTKSSPVYSQQPIVGALFNLMNTATFTYPSSPAINKTPWSLPGANITLSNFSSVRQNIINGVNIDVLTAEIENNLNLSVDSFLQMVEIYEKDAQLQLNQNAERVSDEEWEEFYNILLSAVKKSFYADWITEEDSTIEHTQEFFRFSITQPETGSWPGKFPASVPVIEPQLITPEALVERTTSTYAVELWNLRQQDVADTKKFLKDNYQAYGLDQTLKLALGSPFSGDALPHSINTLQDMLNRVDPAVVAEVTRFIQGEMGLTIEEFNQIVQLRTRYYTPGSSISSDELDRFINLLAKRYKEKFLYPVWMEQESTDSAANASQWNGASLGFRDEDNTTWDKYWLALKARLTKWRVSNTWRNAWVQKLEGQHRLPIIDPDIIQLGEVEGISSDAYTLWSDRSSELLTELQDNMRDLATTPDTAKLEELYESYLDISFADFQLLDVLESSGVILKPYLKQLGLDYSGYRRLLALYNSAVDGTADDLLADEWEEVYAILLQVWKWRTLYAAWNVEEQADDISLSPNFFRLLPDYYPVNLKGDLEVINLWRASYTNRRAWTRKLKAAIEQQETMEEGLNAVISETEDKALPILRDALVKALGDEHASLEDNAQMLTDRFLTDFSVNCCQVTTRVSHSIDVLQRLLWTLHTGVNPNMDIPGIRLNAENFEEEWKWLGSYATWRSAMFVFMYPDNLLSPELRKNQTPKFREIVSQISQSSRFTPDDACYFAGEYNNYVEDVQDLNIQASCNAHVFIPKGSACGTITSHELKRASYSFGQGSFENKVYWNIRIHNSEPTNSAYWKELDQFNAFKSVRVIGSVPLSHSSLGATILLFAVVQDETLTRSLVFLKYNIKDKVWDTEPTTLDLPEWVDYSSVTIPQYNSRTSGIDIIYQSVAGGIYVNKLNAQASISWGDGYKYINHSIGKKYKVLGSTHTGTHYLLLQKRENDKAIYYRCIGLPDKGEILQVPGSSGATYLGCLFDTNKPVNVVYKNNGLVTQVELNVTNVYTDKVYPSLASQPNPNSYNYQGLDDYNTYLATVFGVSLKDIPSTNDYTADNLLDAIKEHTSSNNPIQGSEKLLKLVDQVIEEGIENENDVVASDWNTANNVMYSEYANGVGVRDALYKIVFEHQGVVISERKDTQNETTSSNEANNSPLSNVSAIAHISNDYMMPYASGPYYVFKSGNSDFWVMRTIKKGFTSAFSIYSSTLYYKLTLNTGISIDIAHNLAVNTNSIRRVTIQDNIDVLSNASMEWDKYVYLEEAYYFLPVYLAQQLIKNGHYEEALDWLLTTYDFRQHVAANRVIYEGLNLDGSSNLAMLTRNFDDWLLDPLDPHSLGRTRNNSYLKFTLRTIIECLLEYADANFTIDTVESNSKAAELYEMAIELLNNEVFNYTPAICEAMVAETIEEVKCSLPVSYNDDFEQIIPRTKQLIDRIKEQSVAEAALATYKDDLLGDVGESSFDFKANIDNAMTNLSATIAAQEEASTIEVINENKQNVKELFTWTALSTEAAESITNKALKSAQQALLNSLQQVTGKTANTLELEADQLSWMNKSIAEEQETVPQPVYVEGTPLLPNPSDQMLMFNEHWPNTSVQLSTNYSVPFIPILGQDFCVPPNPVYDSLRLRAALNLFKLRNCMNIAGMKRQVDAYAAPTDATSGIPYVGAGGQIVLPGTVRITPTQYRYQYIIQRAKELVGLAQQLEANFLSLLERKDAEAYSLMKAKQDMALARANVKLQDLRIKVAEGEVDLAVLQKERSELQVEGLEELIAADLNEFERRMLNLYDRVKDIQKQIALYNYILGTAQSAASASTSDIPAAIAGGIYAGLFAGYGGFRFNEEVRLTEVQSDIQAFSIHASQARREQEWNFQKSLAEHDVQIGQQGIRVAKDRLRVTGQERQISNLQLGHAEDTVNFLNNKFTNLELYSWMSGIVENVYAYFLRQATATAKMAQNQLAFERQELPPPFIQDDYWQAPADSTSLSALSGDGSATVDRRGLTGSARLLQDIYKVDQFAFETDKRKLQLSKTFSLSRMAAVEFQQFRETGEITFETPMEYFDRDFPGHYLRLIKRVSVSVIALVPPVDGIKATLTSSGISHVVTKGNTYQNVVVRRDPEVIAFTGAQNATGMFELQADDRFANPFEGSGVHTRWQLKLPTDTNLFNFDTIADVLITVEYTALHSYDYEQEVLRKLDPEYLAERAFSFNEELPDQFYELNNPDQSDTPMEVTFDVSNYDFPAGVKDIYIKSVKVYYVIDDDQRMFFEQQYGTLDTGLQLVNSTTNTGMQHAVPGKSGLISTESGNGGGYLTLVGKQPTGTWTFKLPDDPLVKNLFRDEVIRDIIFIIGFGGTVKPRVNL